VIARAALALSLSLAAAPPLRAQDAPPPDDPAALRARIAALEARAQADAETIARLRAAAGDPGALRGRLSNLSLENDRLRLEAAACGRALEDARREARGAQTRISEAERRADAAAAEARAAGARERRAAADARRAQSDANRWRSEARRCR
jgi:chromosome segregation ATPase